MSDDNAIRVKITDPDHLRTLHIALGVRMGAEALKNIDPSLAKLPGVSVAKLQIAEAEAEVMMILARKNVRACGKQGVDMGAFAIAMIDFHAGEIICRPFDLLGDVEA
jgi:hypothetical protein